MAKLFEARKIIFDVFDERGAVGRDVEETAKEIVEKARIKADKFLQNYSGDHDEVLESINYRMHKGPDGPYAVIGIRDRGEWETWMVGKEGKEQWLSGIVTEVRG